MIAVCAGPIFAAAAVRTPAPDAGQGGGDARVFDIRGGRTTSLQVAPRLGRPIESLAAPGGAYARAIAKDAEGRWSEAANLYKEAHAEWNDRFHRRRSPELENAMHKAAAERAYSEILGTAPPARNLAPALALSTAIRARIYRLKLMAVRAYTGSISPMLLRRAVDGFTEAIHLASASEAKDKPPASALPELRILLAATLRVGGERDAARLQVAHVRQADRETPPAALAMAIYQVADGDLESALAYLDVYARRQDPTGGNRLIYIQNDWDRLRDNPRFERLFRR